MADDKIRDIDKIQEMVQMADSINELTSVLPDQFLVSVGINSESVEDFDVWADELSRLPDDFNNHFIENGWICYEHLNASVAQEAVELADEGNKEAAEEVLVESYDEDTIDYQLNVLKQVEGFTDKEYIEPDKEGTSQSRWELAQKALDDYVANRYHASVPVVIALADGMVQQAHVNSTGEGGNLSAESANHEAWNSIAAHSTGLERLKDVIMRGRLKTRTAEIEIPYRHGIMHGMDLCYDNKLVAAKSWALLFAAGEWAQKAQDGELDPPEQDDQDASLREALETMRKTEQRREKQNECEPRNPIVGDTIPASGTIDEYAERTPEYALVYHLHKWQEKRYDLLASFFQKSDGSPEDVDKVSGNLQHRSLQSFKLVSVEENSAVSADIVVDTQVDYLTGERTESKDVRLIRVRDDGSLAKDEEDGKWTLPNWMVLI
ncbi:hypothetical protein [Halalkalicoccus subterraneus]|uniref:hypothetical protein n=1 Tax=Halalkalicoccus subterraneus TaxID=2675002 RepID=UPI000EFBEB61|nr:hypothetical protein [Halalkalicoccus subterraneus]